MTTSGFQRYSSSRTVYARPRATGGIYSEYGSLIVSFEGTAWFTENYATADGGAIAMMASYEVQITNATFASNTAKIGGAISSSAPNDIRRLFKNCLFYDNIATEGGAVSLYGGAGRDYIATSVFRDNHARKICPTMVK